VLWFNKPAEEKKLLSDLNDRHLTDDLPRLCLAAGEGHLPLMVAEDARRKGWHVVAFCLQESNRKQLAAVTGQPTYRIHPGMMAQNIALAKSLGLGQVVFAGKVNKWVLLRQPRLDAMALSYLRQLWPRNDDGVMHKIIECLADEGMQILPQAQFLGALRLPTQCLTHQTPTAAHWQDIAYGYTLAKQMGAMDVGQTVVVQHGMALAIEAIEGTDRCLIRAGQLGQARAGAIVVKVAKPGQDQRFDLPTVGLRTLRVMHKAGLSVLATEANETLYLEAPAMADYANRHGLVVVSFDSTQL
jgi:UDP-2,3-diacylglucosamine hydrolase